MAWGKRSAINAAVMVVFIFTRAGVVSQEARESCARGQEVHFDAEYAGPWVSGQASALKFQYHLALPAPSSTAWIEVWDGRIRLLKQNVKTETQGEFVWRGVKQVPDTPSNLQLEIFDPGLTSSCGDCPAGSKGDTVSLVQAGTGLDELSSPPDLTEGHQRFLEGNEGLELVVGGRLLTSETQILLREQIEGDVWLDREYLFAQLIDLHHMRVQIPPGYTGRPTVLGMTAERADSKTPWGLRPAQILYIASKGSPMLSSVDPSEVSADESGKDTVRIRLAGSGFKSTSRVLLSLQDKTNTERELKPEFISDKELQFDLPTERFVIDGKWSAIDPVRLWVVDDEPLHISEGQEIEIMPSARFPAYPLKEPVAEIFSVSPYPVPLMEMGEVSATELLVHGQNFNHSQLVVAVIDGKESKLKTLFVSPDELHAWLPAKYWSLQKLRYRFVLHSNEGSCVAEIVDQDD